VSQDLVVGVAAELVLGLIGLEDLQHAANRALHAGLASPAIVALADSDESNARLLFDRVLTELEVALPSTRDAIGHLALETAVEIVEGKIAPYTGAKRIWQLTLCAPSERLPNLDPFIYAASEWEDRPEDRVRFERGIMDEARALLSA